MKLVITVNDDAADSLDALIDDVARAIVKWMGEVPSDDGAPVPSQFPERIATLEDHLDDCEHLGYEAHTPACKINPIDLSDFA